MISLLIVLRVIEAFNHTWERSRVLTRDAEIPDFAACWQQERSQMYFRARTVRVVSPDRVEVQAEGNSFGMSGIRAAPAVFVLKKEGADWKVDSLRVFDSCLGTKR